MAGKVTCIKCKKKVNLHGNVCTNCGSKLDESVTEAIKTLEKVVWRKNAYLYIFSGALIIYSSLVIVPENLSVGLLLIVSAILRLPVISEIVLGQLKFLSGKNYILMTTVLILGGLFMAGLKVVEPSDAEQTKQTSTTIPSEDTEQ